MKQFIKIPSLIQIFVAEWLAVMFLFPIVSKLQALSPRCCLTVFISRYFALFSGSYGPI